MIKLIKNELNIPKNERIFFLGYNKLFHYFLYKNKIFIANWNCQENIMDDIGINNENVYKSSRRIASQASRQECFL